MSSWPSDNTVKKIYISSADQKQPSAATDPWEAETCPQTSELQNYMTG